MEDGRDEELLRYLEGEHRVLDQPPTAPYFDAREDLPDAEEYSRFGGFYDALEHLGIENGMDRDDREVYHDWWYDTDASRTEIAERHGLERHQVSEIVEEHHPVSFKTAKP